MADKLKNNRVSAVIGTDGREARPKHWIAMYTKPRREKKTAQDFIKKGIEVYIPLQVQIRQWSDRKKKVEVPVISMLVFAKVDDLQISTISQNTHVIRIISRSGEKQPAYIPENQIDRLKFVLGQSDVPVIFDSHPFQIDDSVEIIRGYFKGLRGEIHECPDGSTEFIVRINFLGGAKLKINKSDLIHI